MEAIGGNGGGPAIYFEPRTSTAVRRCRVFVSYARVDEPHRLRLDVHLAPVVRDGLIDVWSDRALPVGVVWVQGIRHELAAADIVVLLVTPDFVASAYCFEEELPKILRRNEEDGLRVLPILVKSVDMVHLSIGRFQGLPADLRPISAWSDPDDAWLQVAQGVRRAAEEIGGARMAPYSARPGLGWDLQDYYGIDTCVVDGTAPDVEWAPLNEDGDDLRFDNLVPLSRRHRTRPYQRDLPHHAVFRFGADLRASQLFLRARRHFRGGFPALAFGCARLGDFLAVYYPHTFEAHQGDDWAFLVQSLFYLRYRMHTALLEATLTRVRRRLETTGGCPAVYRAALLLAVANLYQDISGRARGDVSVNTASALDATARALLDARATPVPGRPIWMN